MPALTLLALGLCPLRAASADEGVALASTVSGPESAASDEDSSASHEDPVESDEEPDSSDEGLGVASSEGSAASLEQPAATDEEPAATDEEPAATDEEPAASDEEPETPAEEPDLSGEEPATSDEELGTSAEEPAASDEDPGTSNEPLGLRAGLLSFVEQVSAVLNDRSTNPPPNNTYSYETGFSSGLYPEPPVYLNPTEFHSAIASTDCSGWLSYALDTTAPLHRAALQSQRRLSQYNQQYEGGFLLQEARRLWSRAFVVTHLLRSDYASEVGFAPIERIADVKRGDIVGYALGRYAEPANTSLRRPGDSGHVFIVVGAPSVVSKKTENYDGYGSLSDRAASVLAVPALDSSSIPHFPPDSRGNKKGRFELPPKPSSETAMAGGIGTGTVWFALDESGEVLQARIGPGRRYHDVVAGAAELRDTIALIPEITDPDGNLLIAAFDNTPSHFGKQAYGDVPVRLTGPGGIRVAGDGAVILNGDNDFSGGVKIESGAMVIQSPNALGTGPVEVVGGALILERPALDDESVLRISEGLTEGAIRLEFTGEDVLRAVLIGDQAHLCGTLGSAESEATHPHPAFAGPGVLRVGRPGFPCMEESELSGASWQQSTDEPVHSSRPRRAAAPAPSSWRVPIAEPTGWHAPLLPPQ